MEEEGSTFGAGSSTDSDRGDCAREELVAALNDWVRRTSLTSCQLQEANMVRLRSQTQVMSARERETADNSYGRHFEGKFSCEAFYKFRIAANVLVFQGRRESVQFDCEGRGPEFRESCQCVLKDSSSGRVLLQFRAEETTINQYGGHSIQYDPQVDVEAVAELALMAGCPILSAADVVSFLVCLAGERIVEYFQWQMARELEAVVEQEPAQQVWRSIMSHAYTSPRRTEQAVIANRKRKWQDSGCGGGDSVCAQRTQVDLCPPSVLGKRGRDYRGELLYLA